MGKQFGLEQMRTGEFSFVWLIFTFLYKQYFLLAVTIIETMFPIVNENLSNLQKKEHFTLSNKKNEKPSKFQGFDWLYFLSFLQSNFQPFYHLDLLTT